MTTQEHLTSILGTAPRELVSYFEAENFRYLPYSRIRCLPFLEAVNATRSILRTSVGAHFGLFVLDDAQDSNPYCFVSRGPCAGSVLHLRHDGDVSISHHSLDSFCAAIDGLREDADINDLPSDPDLAFDTVSTLQSLLITQRDLDVLVPIYLAVTRYIPHETRHALAACDDIFVREAFADWLHRHGTREDLVLVERLAINKQDQVAKPAQQAAAKLSTR